MKTTKLFIKRINPNDLDNDLDFNLSFFEDQENNLYEYLKHIKKINAKKNEENNKNNEIINPKRKSMKNTTLTDNTEFNKEIQIKTKDLENDEFIDNFNKLKKIKKEKYLFDLKYTRKK